jgi:hypothetical protein
MDVSAKYFTPCFKKILPGFDQYLVICVFLGFQWPSQTQSHSAQALEDVLCV